MSIVDDFLRRQRLENRVTDLEKALIRVQWLALQTRNSTGDTNTIFDYIDATVTRALKESE
jgi:hypothetical protein